MNNDKMFETALELTSDAERLSEDLERLSGDGLRIVIAEDTYAGIQGIAAKSRTLYVEGELEEEARGYLEDQGFNVEEYGDAFDETEVLAENDVTVESPTEEAFMERLEEKITEQDNYEI